MMTKGTWVVWDNLSDQSAEVDLEICQQMAGLLKKNYLASNDSGVYSDVEIQFLVQKKSAKVIAALAEKNWTVFYQSEAGKVLAFGLLVQKEERWEVKYLNVDPAAKRNGLGQEIVRRREEKARELGVDEIYLESLLFSGTIAFHKKMGYSRTESEKPLYYTVLMKKRFD